MFTHKLLELSTNAVVRVTMDALIRELIEHDPQICVSSQDSSYCSKLDALTYESIGDLSRYEDCMEKKMLALGNHAPRYLYLSLKFNAFTDKAAEYPQEDRPFVSIVRQSLKKQLYYVMLPISQLILPWSDCILVDLVQRSNLRQLMLEPATNTLLAHPDMSSLANAYFCGAFGQHTYDGSSWINKTMCHAPSVNGVACVGKSTILAAAAEASADPNAQVLKVSKVGTFRGKDDDQVLAMQYQLTALSLAEIYYTSVMDRCPFNNMIWRLIMNYMDTTENVVEKFCRDLSRITLFTIERMSIEPIIVILDNDICANRRRMFKRNHGQDRLRCKIENYVKAQNMVYGVFARLCGWPVFCATDLMENSLPLQELIAGKINSNIEFANNVLPPAPYSTTKHNTTFPQKDSENYLMARTIGIVK